jgi:hypothetical protein
MSLSMGIVLAGGIRTVDSTIGICEVIGVVEYTLQYSYVETIIGLTTIVNVGAVDSYS